MHNDNHHAPGSIDDPSLRSTGTGRPEGVNSKGTGEVQHFLSDLEDLVTATTSLTGEDLARAKAKLSERLASAKASIEEGASAISHRARAGVTATDRYVHEQPWKAIGIGAVIGLLMGALLMRRS